MPACRCSVAATSSRERAAHATGSRPGTAGSITMGKTSPARSGRSRTWLAGSAAPACGIAAVAGAQAPPAAGRGRASDLSWSSLAAMRWLVSMVRDSSGFGWDGRTAPGTGAVARSAGWSGARSSAASVASHSAAKRATVADSNSALAKTQSPRSGASSCPLSGSRNSAMSNFDVRSMGGSIPASTPGMPSCPAGVFCSTNSACTSGLRLRSRGTPAASTMRSNGRPSCSKAASTSRRHAASTSRKLAPALRRERSGTTLTKKPISGSSAASCRPATSVPSTRSSMPVARCSQHWKLASSTMKGVTCSARASACTCPMRSPSIRSATASPSMRATGGRARSAGSASAAGAPASTPRQ
ncbi:hypothetical protein D9M72_391030 [compost metagenome]